MEKLRNTLNKVLNLLAGLSMTVMVVLTTYQVIVRYIFNSPSTWSEELVGYLFGWSTMLGATIVSGERGHMNIPVLVDRFNPTMRKAFHIFAEVIAFIFSAAILTRLLSYNGISSLVARRLPISWPPLPNCLPIVMILCVVIGIPPSDESITISLSLLYLFPSENTIHFIQLFCQFLYCLSPFLYQKSFFPQLLLNQIQRLFAVGTDLMIMIVGCDVLKRTGLATSDIFHKCSDLSPGT